MSFGLPGLDDSDPLASLFSEGAGRAPVQYPSVPPQQSDSEIKKLLHGGLSGLGYVGATLDKAFGGRAVRAALDTVAGSGKHPGDIASIIPFSDSLGITNPEDSVSGSELIKNTTGYDPSKGNWAERNLVGPAAEIALDPSTWLGGVGTLTHAGTAAKAAGKTVPGVLGSGFLDAVRAGERTAYMGLSGPRVASALEGAAGVAEQANAALRAIPGVAGAEDALGRGATQLQTVGRGLFSAQHGWVLDPEIQASHAAIKFPGDEVADVAARGTYNDLLQRRLGLEAAGHDPQQLSRFLRQKAEDVPEHFYDQNFVGQLPAEAHQLGEDIRHLGGEVPRAQEAAAGYASPELQDEIAYTYRQKNLGGLPQEKNQNWLGRSRGMPYAKVEPRLESLKHLPGGTMQIEDLLDTPGLTGGAEWMGQEAATKEIMRQNLGLPQGAEFTPLPGSEMTGHAQGTADFLSSIDRNKYINPETGLREPLFDPDVVRAAAMRSRRAGTAAASADTAMDVMRRIGKPGVPGATGTRPITDVLSGLGLNTEQGFRKVLEGLGETTQHIDPGDVKALESLAGQFHIPEGTASGLTDLLQRYQTPHEWGPVGRKLKEYTQAVKKGLYTIWPASQGRNYESAVYQNMVDTGLKPFSQPYRMTEQALLGHGVDTKIPEFAHLAPEAQREALLSEAYAHRIIGEPAGEFAAQGQKPFTGNPLAPRESVKDVAKQFGHDVRTGPWKAPWQEESAGVKMGQGLNTIVEERVRLAEYAHLRQQGWTPEAAAKQVFETHFDYEKGTSDFMKNVGGQAFLFPTYSSHNIPKQVSLAVTNPGKQLAPIRFSGAMANQDDQGPYVPQYLQSGLNIPLPSEGLPEGTQRFLTSLGLPFEEALGRLKTGASPFETAQRTGQSFLSMINPAIKAPLEWLSGTQLHTGRALEDLYPGQVQSLGGLLPRSATIAVSEAISASPLSRLASTINRLVDERKMTPAGAASTLAQLTTGLRTSDVDTEKYQNIDARNAIEDMLKESPHVRQSSDLYVPKDLRGELTPEEAQQMQMFNAVKARGREASKAKRLGVQSRQ